MSDFGQSTPDGERVQFSRDGAAHVVLERKETGAGRTWCRRPWLRRNQPREAHPDTRTCTLCRRAYFGQPRRQHKTGPTIGVHPGSTAPKGTMTPPLSLIEKAHRKEERDEKAREMAKHAHRQRMEERPGFGRFLRGMLPKFLKRGRGG